MSEVNYREQKQREDFFCCRCPDCHHEWIERVSLPMNLTAFSARLKGMAFCPKCASKRCVLLLGPERDALFKRLGPESPAALDERLKALERGQKPKGTF